MNRLIDEDNEAILILEAKIEDINPFWINTHINCIWSHMKTLEYEFTAQKNNLEVRKEDLVSIHLFDCLEAEILPMY
jgi:hypothetical protein